MTISVAVRRRYATRDHYVHYDLQSITLILWMNFKHYLFLNLVIFFNTKKEAQKKLRYLTPSYI